MHWSQAVDLYCERTDPSFWAEPVNAVSNVAFLIAAAVAYWQYRRRGLHDWPVAALIAIAAVVGVGSFIFHTVATQGTMLFDVIPIAVFIYSYLLFALRRYLGLSLTLSVVLLVGFAALTFAEAALVPHDALNGSHAYLPALVATFVVGLLVRGPRRQADPRGRRHLCRLARVPHRRQRRMRGVPARYAFHLALPERSAALFAAARGVGGAGQTAGGRRLT